MNDYTDEVKKLINQYKKESIVFGKDLAFLLSRVKESKEEIEKEILSCKDLIFVEKQIKGNEIRYVLFFIYNKRKGKQYVITFRDKNLRIITIFPLGRRTIRKYKKKGLNIRVALK